MTTLSELNETITHEGVLVLYDILCVDSYNNYIIQKTNEKKNK